MSAITIALAVIGGCALFIGAGLFLINLHELFERVSILEERMYKEVDK